jgi:Ca-activated chloride channel family protein
MMSIIVLVLIGATSPATAAPFLAQSRAVIAGQAGEHERAQKLLQEALVTAPHDAGLLYDAGVSEFKCGNYTHAVSYFEKAAQHTEKPALQHEALFNAGNAHAHLKEYEAALQSYEKILLHDATHERAQHNYKVVKKLKEQEEQQQQKQDENKQEQDEQDKEDKQDKQDQEKHDNDQQQDNPGDDSKSDQSDEDSDQSDDAQQQQNGQKKQGKDTNSSNQKKQQQEGNDKQQKESPTHSDQSSDTQERDYNNQHEESRNAHNKPQEKSEKKESAQAQSSNSATGAQPSQDLEQPQVPEALAGPDKQWMRCALETCDKQDTTHNKQLLKAVVGADKGDRRAVRSSW